MRNSCITRINLIQSLGIILFSLISISSFDLFAQSVEETEEPKEQSEAEDVAAETQKLKEEIYGEELDTPEIEAPEPQEQPEEEKKPQAVIVNGDVVEYIAEENRVVAEGNIEVFYGDTVLTCDKISVDTQTKDALAEGNVVLTSPDGVLKGEKVTYNFDSMKGKVTDLRFEASPYYGAGVSGNRLNESEILVRQSFFSTCDLDKPHYRMQTRSLKIYWGDKIVANNVMLFIGNAPILYLPRYVHKFNETRPRARFVFGREKNWGTFILSAWRYELNNLVQGRLNLDLRERRGFAWGVTNPYETPGFGRGIFKSYYTNERKTDDKYRWYKFDLQYDKPNEKGYITKPLYKERYLFNLRHKWQINEKTDLLLEYFKTRDGNFVQDYFERRYEREMQQKSYLQILRNLTDYSSLSFYMQKRTNRIFSETEELPRIGYVISGSPLGNNRFYFTSENYFSNLNSKTAAPSDTDESETRFDLYNKLSYNTKVAFIETTPYVAVRETMYSRDRFDNKWPSPRTVFYSGLDMTTKFYRIFNVQSDLFDLHYLRHIIQPSANFAFNHEPTIPAGNLLGIDGTDTITRSNGVTLELLNKLQTKRASSDGGAESTVDVLRYSINSTYSFKPKGQGGSRFSDFTFDLELLPRDWIRIDIDATHAHREDYFRSANFDLFIYPSERFSFGAGYRYNYDAGRSFSTEFKYKINPKWSMRVYQRYDFESHVLKEQEYALKRDLHCWELEIVLNTKKREGGSIWVVFTLKAFPDMTIEFEKSYYPPKPGSRIIRLYEE